MEMLKRLNRSGTPSSLSPIPMDVGREYADRGRGGSKEGVILRDGPDPGCFLAGKSCIAERRFVSPLVPRARNWRGNESGTVKQMVEE